MRNDTERLPPHQALVAVVLMNLVLWAVFYGLWEAWSAAYRLARSLLP